MEANLSTPPVRRDSSIRVLRHALQFSFRFLLPLIKATWPLLLTLELLELVTDQYFGSISEMIQRRGIENPLLLTGTAFLEFVSGLFFMAAWFLAIVPLLSRMATYQFDNPIEPAPRLGRSFRLYLNPLLIEQTRVFAAILWRLPFFIVLSPVEYIRLSLVPYVVVLEPKYNDGQIDALDASRRLTSGRWILLGSLLLASLLVPLLIKQLVIGNGNIWIWENPLRTMINCVFQFFANLLSSMILFAVFRSLQALRSGPGNEIVELRRPL